MKNFFRNFLCAFGEVIDDGWFAGIEYLISDDLISFYAFCSSIIVEIAFIWIVPKQYSIALTIILACHIVNLLITAFGKATINPKLFMNLGRIFIVILSILAIIVNIKMGIILTLIPFAFSYFAVCSREYQCTNFSLVRNSIPRHKAIISILFENPYLWAISQLIVVGFPLLLFALFILVNPNLHVVFKIVLPILFILIMPYLSVIEDDWCTQNLFELLSEKE